jgi:hypothetical protein
MKTLVCRYNHGIIVPNGDTDKGEVSLKMKFKQKMNGHKTNANAMI